MSQHSRPPRNSRQSPPINEKRQVDRAIRIIEVLAEADSALGVSEIARRANLPKSTTARMLSDLAGMDLVVRSRRLHLPGSRILMLADRFEPPGATTRRRLLLPHMLWLREGTGLAVSFGTLRYRRVRFESVLYSTSRLDALARLPLWAPTYCTASGKILLAYTPRGEHLLPDEHTATVYTRDTVVDHELLRRELDRIRQNGVASNGGEYVENLHSIAAPVFGRHDLVGVLAVCGAPEDFHLRSVETALRRAASEASATMRRYTEPMVA